jgi:hypothetical protein
LFDGWVRNDSEFGATGIEAEFHLNLNGDAPTVVRGTAAFLAPLRPFEEITDATRLVVQLTQSPLPYDEMQNHVLESVILRWRDHQNLARWQQRHVAVDSPVSGMPRYWEPGPIERMISPHSA